MFGFARSVRDYVLYWRRRQLIRRDWRARHRKVYSLHPSYSQACSELIESQHRQLWRPICPRIRLETLRVCHGISGKADPRIVPEEVFAADLERCLNRFDWAPFLSHKSFYARFFPSEIFPAVLLNCIGGDFFDQSGEPLSRAEAMERIKSFAYPVICKPNMDSSGGAGVTFPGGPNELADRMTVMHDFVVQPVLRQHPFFEAFNQHGLNTLRVNTYKSVKTDKIHILNVALRMGRGGSLDNETAGGIVCFINGDGRLNDFAVDKHGGKFERHPDTGLRFADGYLIPDFTHMKDTVHILAGRLPMMRLAGWDMILDSDDRWRCIEVNLAGHTIRFAQYAGQPFFGDFTDEVIQHCIGHPNFKRACQKVF